MTMIALRLRFQDVGSWSNSIWKVGFHNFQSRTLTSTENLGLETDNDIMIRSLIMNLGLKADQCLDNYHPRSSFPPSYSDFSPGPFKQLNGRTQSSHLQSIFKDISVGRTARVAATGSRRLICEPGLTSRRFRASLSYRREQAKTGVWFQTLSTLHSALGSSVRYRENNE